MEQRINGGHIPKASESWLEDDMLSIQDRTAQRTRTTKTKEAGVPSNYYTVAQSDFIRAVDVWKQKHAVNFPKLSDYFEIMLDLGYHKD